MKKTIVVSGITLRKGGTLTILRSALNYLSGLAQSGEWRIVALVHSKELCGYPNIEYIEVPLKGWIGRLWYEYVTMHRISKEIGPIYLWLSMHDVTPRVVAERQAVYCQTSFPFYNWKWRDFRFDPKIPIFAMLTRFYYKARVQNNRYLIVQQDWLRRGLSKMLGVAENKFIVAPPETSYERSDTPFEERLRSKNKTNPQKIFLYPSTADCHKNFETLCKASKTLEDEVGKGKFKVVLTVKGIENQYAQWLYKNWGNVESIDFYGLMDKDTLYKYYCDVDCLVFPSNIETWGLPISEYMEMNGGPMIVSDLPYANNTTKGANSVAFFEPDNANDLAQKMKELITGNQRSFLSVPEDAHTTEPYAKTWQDLFEILLRK